MVGIQALDILADLRGPLGDDGGGAAAVVSVSASWLVGQLPGEYRRGLRVSRDESFDPVLVCRLACGRCVPVRCIA